jgi:hypothetical protein
MIGMRGVAAKVANWDMKNEIHERWKARMWGLARLRSLILRACRIKFGMRLPELLGGICATFGLGWKWVYLGYFWFGWEWIYLGYFCLG